MAALATVAASSGSVAAGAPRLLALTEDGGLLVLRADRPAEVRRVEPRGFGGRLLGIDVRPADGKLYGVTSTNDLYRLDPATGAATPVSSLTVPFDGDVRSGVDFNPQADRLRLVSRDGQNLRVNVILGATAVDGPLAFRSGDPNAGKRPHVTAAAYTHNVADAPDTKLFDIDGDLDILVLQDPPNDGLLTTVGPLGVDFGPLGGFDILTDAAGHDQAWAASGSTLYTIDLASGAARAVGTIGDGRASVIGLAAIAEP
jgi:hypothetical protein